MPGRVGMVMVLARVGWREWRAVGALLILIASLGLAQAAPAAGLGSPRYAAILVDPRTGEVLYANAADELRHPASITKVMTLYLAFDALVAGKLKLSDPITISRHAAAQRPSRLGLAAGKSIGLDDAIRIVTVKSANDLAVAIAERIGGSEAEFAEMMTRKARALGMTSTTFTNASGLADAGNVTTARDIATLSTALLRVHPSYYAYFGQRGFSYERQSFTNHNHLLGKMTGLDGIKTGYTVDAGFTLAASAQRDGRRLIAVVLGEPSIAARNRDVTALLDAGFAVLDRRRAGEETSVAANLPTLNHPALRIAALTGEQGSRNDLSAHRPIHLARAPKTRAAARASVARHGMTRFAARANGARHKATRTAAHAAHSSRKSASASSAKMRRTRLADKGGDRKSKRD